MKRFLLLAGLLALLLGCASRQPLTPVPATASHAQSNAIVFRMDDAEQGDREVVIGRIIAVFERNGVPLDVGVMPHARGRETFRLPTLKPYLARGVVDISMHGYGHNYREADCAYSGSSYAEFHDRLVRARWQFEEYYGVAPVAFTVPFDFFDCSGYRAISDAGFRIFSTDELVEPHLSRQPLDHLGRRDPEGMWRLSTAGDVSSWDARRRQWGEVLPAGPDTPLFRAVQHQLQRVNVAVISLHPQAFLDDTGRPDTDKLAGLDDIVRFSKTLGQVTTFARLYREAASQP